MSGAKKKILIVDDEKYILKMLESRLKANGFEVMKAGSGDEALEKARRNPPDLFILDLAMPGRNGYQICRELKENSVFKNIPVIILSAWVRDKRGEDTALADLYITKPFEPETFLEQIRCLLEEQGRFPKPRVS